MVSNMHEEEVLVENNEKDESENFYLNKYDISSYPADYTIKTLLDKFEKTVIVPDFQRNYVWGKDRVKQSRLVESFLLRLPVPQIFLFQKKGMKEMLIIDGFQRVNTIKMFYDGKFPLKGVQPQWEGKYYDDLDDLDKEELDNSTLRAIIIRQIEPDDDSSSMFHIFERLNTGGVTLSPMEIRKAIFYDEFYLSLEKLNKNQDWNKITGKTVEDQRLRDIEWILRILALRDSGFESYIAPMKEFLTKFMSKNAKFVNPHIENNFIKACEVCVNQLGEKPFHIPNGRLNIAVMEVMLSYISENLDKNNITDTYEKIKNDEKFIESIKQRDTSRTDILKDRFILVGQYFNA